MIGWIFHHIRAVILVILIVIVLTNANEIAAYIGGKEGSAEGLLARINPVNILKGIWSDAKTSYNDAASTTTTTTTLKATTTTTEKETTTTTQAASATTTTLPADIAACGEILVAGDTNRCNYGECPTGEHCVWFEGYGTVPDYCGCISD